MNLVPLVDAADRGELILVNGGMCHYHSRKDGVVVIRELLVVPERRSHGIGKSLVTEVRRRHPSNLIRAKCPTDWSANKFWDHIGFTQVPTDKTSGEDDTNNVIVWEQVGKLLSVELIYCASGNPVFAHMANDAGWLYGARLPDWFDTNIPLHFADQDWKCPNRAKYIEALATHRPVMATVLDIERREQLDEVMTWAEEASQYVSRVVVIPKVGGVIEEIPETIGAASVVLGYSVPTSYGGTDVPLSEFKRRPCHLLGGSPQAQLRLFNHLNVTSVDGGMLQQQAIQCRYWSPDKGEKGHWQQLRDTPGGNDVTENVHHECFRKSLINIRQAWVDKVSWMEGPQSTHPDTPPKPKRLR